ncbi:hypothetical protein CPC08DRAFT_702456 [Agrocybe pediades]|nr:hypothetical protein CPC08DRAFT_702456 [Agrocybe pediades]
MAVKELVQQYESSASRSSNSSASPQPSTPSQDGSIVLPPRPARFIRHPPPDSSHLVRRIPSTTDLNDEALPALSRDSSTIPGYLLENGKSSSLASPTTPARAPAGLSNIQQEPALSSTTLVGDVSVAECNIPTKHVYPPSSTSGTLWHGSYDSAQFNPATHSSRRRHQHHQPVAAPIVFSRDAYPLNLPKLDKNLAALPAPFLGEASVEHGGMFPPLDALAKTGRSMDDLETNSTVAPAWRSRVSLLGGSVNFLIGVLGSSALASFYSLQGLINTVQIFALILSTIVPSGKFNVEDKWKQLFLGTIPNVLALNFAPVVIQSLLFLAAVMLVGGCLLFYFHRCTTHCDRYTSIEGLQQTETKGSQWGIVIVTFLLIIIYLPLSTMSLHVLVWSEELWAVPNPYTNSTVFPPVVAPLGPVSEFRDPLDFCWTTTMKRNEVNFAPIIMVLSAVTFFFFAIWFPLALRRVIQRSVPKVDKYTELGRPRSKADLDGEYHRLLNRDKNPFAFLYNGFRRGWGTYISTYLFAKLNTLVIVAIIDPDNCFFRSLSRSTVPIIRQTLLLLSTLCFFIAQCTFTPFMDPVNNASEWTSRLNYLSTSATALAITLNIPGKDIVDSYVLYSIYIVTYGLGFYFSCINFNWMQKIVKRLTRRIDFSIDIFSPRLDVSSTSIHTKRRIWQEAISALLLTNSDCKIPKRQSMTFAQARDSEFPPYLLDFLGTPGERHVENLKILREVGSMTYTKAVALTTGPDFAWYRHLEDVIQKNYIGPDSYWKSGDEKTNIQCTSHFGNAWWIPFPPTLVIRYDDGPYAVLTDAHDLEAYISQNSSHDIQRRRFVRMSLRALEGRMVRWPYEHVQSVGSHANWWCCGRRYRAVTSSHYEYALLTIKRRGHLKWQGLHLGSGFEIQLKYSKDIILSGEIIGLNEDYDLTSSLARFLEINRELVDESLFAIDEKISHYRMHHRKECRWKSRVLTYKFLSFVYDQPRDPDGVGQSLLEFEKDSRVQQLVLSNHEVFKSAYTRLKAVSTSEAATWWYIFWDDLWRRNYDTISGLQKYATDFNPHYKTSIAYTPLPRAALESFLIQRGMLHTKPRWSDFFHAGFLNKLYLRLNDCIFKTSNQAIMFHLGNNKREMDMDDIDALTQAQSSTLGTGAGTDHDASWIRARPAYRWEGMLTDPPNKIGHKIRRKWIAKLGAWMGVTPLWRQSAPSEGLFLDVKVEGGRYVLLDEHDDHDDRD